MPKGIAALLGHGAAGIVDMAKARFPKVLRTLASAVSPVAMVHIYLGSQHAVAAKTPNALLAPASRDVT